MNSEINSDKLAAPDQPGVKGDKGELSHIENPARDAKFRDVSKLGWCYLETKLTALGYKFFLEQTTSTSKNIIVIKPPSPKAGLQIDALSLSSDWLIFKENQYV